MIPVRFLTTAPPLGLAPLEDGTDDIAPRRPLYPWPVNSIPASVLLPMTADELLVIL